MRLEIRCSVGTSVLLSALLSLTSIPVSAQTVIAVIDSGVDATHPDLAGQLVSGSDFIDPGTAPDDEQGHGTEIAGILVANGAVTGLCPSCRVMPLRVTNSHGFADQSDIAAAIQYAISQDADVILVSLGSIGGSVGLAFAVAAAETAGIPIIAPTGNLEVMHVLYPAAWPSVISTSAMLLSGERLRLSNSSGRETVAAIGEDVLTIRLGGGTVERTGTSVAAARVAASVALLREANPSLDTTQIRQAIRWGTTPHPLPDWTEYFEMGVHDPTAALARQSSGFIDVGITRVTVFPESPLTGQANFARVRVVNQGNVTTSPLELNITWGGSPVGAAIALDPLAPGASIEEDVALPVAGSVSTVSVIATVTALPGETPVANNTVSKDVTYTSDPVHDLDLIVSELSEPVLEAGSIFFDVLVRNRGNQTEADTVLEVTVDGDLVLAQSLDLPVGAQETTQVSWPISPATPSSGHYLRVRTAIPATDDDPEDNDWYLDFDVGNRDGTAQPQYADTPSKSDVIMDAPWRSERGYVPVLFFFPQFKGSRRVETARIRDFDVTQGAAVGNPMYRETRGAAPVLSAGVSIVGPIGENITVGGGITPAGTTHFWHYMVRIPKALVGIPGSQGNFGVHYLHAETQWSLKFLRWRKEYEHTRVLRVRFDDSPLPTFDTSDRYFDAHVHTIAEQTTRNRFKIDAANKNFGGPIAMLLESSYVLGLVDQQLDNGNWEDFKDRVVVTDHNVFYSGLPFDSPSTPGYGPTAGNPALERDWYRNNLGKLAGEEIALASGSNQAGSTLNIGHHFLAYDTLHVEGPWHGGDLAGGGENNANDMTTVLTAMKGHNATGFGYAAHPNLSPFIWPAEYFDQAIGLPTAQSSAGGPHVNSIGTEFLFKGSQIWNAKAEEIATDNEDLNATDYTEINPFNGGHADQRFVYSQAWATELADTFDQYQGLVRGGFAFSFVETPKTRFLRKVFMSAGTDAHGDFNYLDDIKSTALETAADTGTMTSNAYARVRTYALVHDRTFTGSEEETAHDAYREGNTVLTDGPICRLRIDSEGRHDTEPGADPRWHDAVDEYENAEGRIGGSGTFDGGRSVLIPQPDGSGDPNAWIETKWEETVDPDHDAIDTFTLTNTAASAELEADVPSGPKSVVKEQKMPGAAEGMSLAEISAITMEGTQASTEHVALSERCITNPIWAVPVDINVSHPGVCPIPAGALTVDFHFPISIASEAGVFIAPLDGAGNSGAGIQLQPAPGWQEENATTHAKWKGKNTSAAIPCPPGGWDAGSHTAAADRWSYVVYMDDPREAYSNQLNDIGRTFVVNKQVPYTTEVDHFEYSVVEFVLDIPEYSYYSPVTVRTRGPSTHHVDLSQIYDSDLNTFDQVPAEFVDLSTKGTDPILGPVEVRLNSYFPSVGQIEENQQVTPGVLDLPPFVPGTGSANSNFQTYLEISLPYLGLTLKTEYPAQLQAVITHKPAKAGDVYTSPTSLQLVDLMGEPAGTIASISYEPDPAPSDQTFSGTAAGGTIDYTIDGVSGQLSTVAGWTDEDVAAALASEINSNLSLAEKQITAIHDGATTTVYGSVEGITIDDAGLFAPSIPALSMRGLIVLFSCLIAAAAFAIRRGSADDVG